MRSWFLSLVCSSVSLVKRKGLRHSLSPSQGIEFSCARGSWAGLAVFQLRSCATVAGDGPSGTTPRCGSSDGAAPTFSSVSELKSYLKRFGREAVDDYIARCDSGLAGSSRVPAEMGGGRSEAYPGASGGSSPGPAAQHQLTYKWDLFTDLVAETLSEGTGEMLYYYHEGHDAPGATRDEKKGANVADGAGCVASYEQRWCFKVIMRRHILDYILNMPCGQAIQLGGAASDNRSGPFGHGAYVALFHGSPAAVSIASEGFRLVPKAGAEVRMPDGIFLTPSLTTARIYGHIRTSDIIHGPGEGVDRANGAPAEASNAILLCLARLGNIYNRFLDPNPFWEKMIAAGQWRKISDPPSHAADESAPPPDSYMDWLDSNQYYCVTQPDSVLPVIMLEPFHRQ